MKIAVIGAGNTGHAIAAHMRSKNIDVNFYTRSEEKAEIINKKGIDSTGICEGNFSVFATTDMEKAVEGAQYILVSVTANAHKELAEKLKKVIGKNQRILIFNSNWGAFQFKQVFANDIEEKNLIIGETSAQLYGATSAETGKVNFRTKEQVYVSCVDSSKTAEFIQGLKPCYPTEFVQASSIFETTLSSTNPVIHVPITLFNATRVENAQDFKFYAEGVSFKDVEYILNMDKERIAVAKALGADIDDVLTAINNFWLIKHDTLYDALVKNTGYAAVKGPTTFDHRYITEDIPYGIAPLSKLGRLFGVETPYADAIVKMFSLILGRDLQKEGIDFTKEDFSV